MRRSRTSLPAVVGLLLILISACGVCQAAESRPIWLAVARADLSASLKPLAEKRRNEGFEPIVSHQPIAAALAALPRRPQFLLLVGSDDSGKEPSKQQVPAKRLKLYRWRGEQRKEFASDMAWGDLDGDGMPDIPVGRIPARSPADVDRVVRKILAFESQPPTSADLQTIVWLGSPEYDATINALASSFAVAMVQTGGPRWLRPWFVSGNPGDPFCGWPPDQPVRFTRQLKQGGIASVLMGHASADAFYSMTFAGRPVWYVADDAAKVLGQGPAAAPMFFFSCESGNFAQSRPCEAEEFLLLPGGPVAVVAATTESHPLTNYFSGVCLLKAFGGRESRLGALWLNAQREAKRSRNPLVESVLRDAEGSLDAEVNVVKLKRDQMLMYVILGDPATRLRLPERLEATIERTAAGWRWKAKKPPGAVGIEVAYRPIRPPLVSWKGLQAGQKEAARASDAANAAFAFAPLASPAGDAPWQGEVERSGTIRLVAHDANRLYVAVLKTE
jgi:hypothetical protein